MNESQTRLLIQRELDGNLSQEEENRLRRVLMVNDSAVSFRANLGQVAAAAKGLELPELVRPGDSSQLADEIIDQLPVVKGKFWDPLLDIFSQKKSGSRDSDPRSTRSVSSKMPAQNKGTASNTTANSGTHQALNQNQYSSQSPNQYLSKIAPEVLAPAKCCERDKTPNGLPAVDQYITGTHSSLGGLAKKLGKNVNNHTAEDVGKTLADAIREKVHESLRDEHSPPVEVARNEISFTTASEIYREQEIGFPEEIEQDVPTRLLEPNSSRTASTIGLSPDIVQASITTEFAQTKINLGSSMVLTVSSTPWQSVNPQSMHIDEQPANELQWQSGNYPPVAQTMGPVQAETGPLMAFPFTNPPINHWAPASQLPTPSVEIQASLENPWAQPSELDLETTRNTLPEQNAKPQAQVWTPEIVPVVRKSLPIEEIGERINYLFQDMVETNSNTPVQDKEYTVDAVKSQSSPMEDDVRACLSSIGRLADIGYAVNSPATNSNLGKFLLNSKTIASIESCINKEQNQTHARILTIDAARQLESVLEPILRIPGVAGYMVCGYDGLVIYNKLQPEFDVELLGGCALVTFMNSHSILKVMGHTRLKQMIFKTPAGNLLLADFGKGFLVTLTAEVDAVTLTALTDTIESVCYGT